MTSDFDLVIRNGLIVDGSGGLPYRGDVAVLDGRIAEVGEVKGSGATEVDAKGHVVTPGFVDPHTHYDGQAIWSEHVAPSSLHGVTTVVVGNCGIGFAPCRPADHDVLVSAMEGVEDIPEAVMTEGLPWDWETFPQFLDALDSRQHDIDIAAYLPHSPLRVYAMGERGANREPATAEDIATMKALAVEAMRVGAVGFSTSRTVLHRRGDGEHVPTFEAAEAELTSIAAAVSGYGIVQMVTDLRTMESEGAQREEFELLCRISQASTVPVSFSLTQDNKNPEGFRELAGWVDEANQNSGVSLRPQYATKAIGLHVGHALSYNPFSACQTYRGLAELPWAERIIELRKPEIRRRLTTESPDDEALPVVRAARQFDRMFVLGDTPKYEQPAGASVAALAAAKGVSAQEYAYDLLLENDGRAILYVAVANYANLNLDHIREIMTRADSVIGLGDGGAHYGMICDSSYPTFVLTHWTRERESGRLSLQEAVRLLSSQPAELLGLTDRGSISVGRKADLNVIDYDNLRLNHPELAYDLPGGGRRLNQTCVGFRHTFVAGEEILRDDRHTGKLPGRLVRGAGAMSA